MSRATNEVGRFGEVQYPSDMAVGPVFAATDSAGSAYAIGGESSLIQRFDVQRRVR
jgi:hypothetical protein